MNYWLDLFTGRTWDEFRQAGATVSGFRKTQRQQGYWRVWLHLNYPHHNCGDSYSSLLDHVQPPLAMLSLVFLPLSTVPHLRLAAPLVALLLLLAQIPFTGRLLKRLRQPRYLMFAVMSYFRAYWRGFGMTSGLIAYALHRRRRPSRQ